MRYIGWTLLIAFWVIFAAFLHYTLPQKDIVRIVDTFEQRVDFGENSWFWAQQNSGNALNQQNRDVLFIQTVRANGRPMVYRNEDTSAGWPPYFKFDTNDLQTEAADLKSTAENPKWVLVRHYGWRNQFFSVFPNAITIRQVDGPDASKGIPWINISVLTLIAAVFYAIWVRWRRFRRARIDPKLEEWQDNWEAAGDAVEAKRGRIRRWLDTWRSK